MRSQYSELHNSKLAISERKEEEEQYEEFEEYEGERESMDSSVLCFTPEVSDELSELVDREIIPCLVPSVRGMERRRHQLEQLASCITEAIRCVKDQDGDQVHSLTHHIGKEQNDNTTSHDGYGNIRFFIFGSVNMRTVLPDGDNDVTIEVDGLLSPHKTNQIVYPPNPLLVITPSHDLTNQQTSQPTKHYLSSEQLVNEETNSNHESLSQVQLEDANSITVDTMNTLSNNRPLHDTTTTFNNNNKKYTTNMDDVNTINASVLPVTTDSNAANVDGSLQLGTLADGRPIYAPPAALTIAGNELLSRVRDYLVHEQQHQLEHQHDSTAANNSHHLLSEYAGVNNHTCFPTNNINSSAIMTKTEVDTVGDVSNELIREDVKTSVVDNHKSTCTEVHSSANEVETEHINDVHDNREQKSHSCNYNCQCEKIPEIFVEAFVPAEVRVLKVVMEGCSYDLTINQFGGINCVRFLHEMDRLIGHAHLLKRTLLLLKSWASYEAHILGGQGGYLSSYAVTIMLIALLNTVSFVEDEIDEDSIVANTENDECTTCNSKHVVNSDESANDEKKITSDYTNINKSFHDTCKKSAKIHKKVNVHHERTRSITPLKLIARFIKFYRYFDYDTYCVTAFGALKLSVLSEHINNKIPLDLSCLEIPVTGRNYSRNTTNKEIEPEVTHSTEQDCNIPCQFSDKLNHKHKHNQKNNVSGYVQNKKSKKKNNTNDQEEASEGVLHAKVSQYCRENANSPDMTDLGLTNEGKQLFGSLIHRRTPPLFTVQEIKYLLHEMNTERETERWNWFTSHSHNRNGKVSEIQVDNTSIHNDNSDLRCNGVNIKEGMELIHSNTASDVSESSKPYECQKGQEIIQLTTPIEEQHNENRKRVNAHSSWVKRAAVDDRHLICPSCNVLLFPIRSMNVLDPLRWSSNMVRGICRNHAQRILKAFSEGLTRFARASDLLRRSHLCRTSCELFHSNNVDTSSYNGTLRTMIATPTPNMEMKTANMATSITNMESINSLSNKTTSMNECTHSSVLEQTDMRLHSGRSYNSCSNINSNSSSGSSNINIYVNHCNDDANLPTPRCTCAERKVLHYLFGNTIHMIHKYSDVNFPWDNLNQAVNCKKLEELHSEEDKESKELIHKEEKHDSSDKVRNNENECNKNEITNKNADKRLSSRSCQTCFVPSILCVPDIGRMCAAQCVFNNTNSNNLKSIHVNDISDKETVVTAKTTHETSDEEELNSIKL